MLSGKRIGPVPRVRQYQLDMHPTIFCLRDCLRHVSSAPSGATVNISWQNGSEEYTISLSYNHPHTADSKANWKSYRKTRHQSELIWEHYTNDITLVYNLITEQLGLGSLALENEGILSTKNSFLESAETRQTEFLKAGLRDNLRRFIAAMQNDFEDKENANTFSTIPVSPLQIEISGQKQSSTIPNTNAIPSTPLQKEQPQALRLVDSLDLRCSRPLLDKFMVPGLRTFSHAAFLFLLEHEYYKCLHNNATMSLLLYRVEYSTNRPFVRQKPAAPMLSAGEIAKRITATVERKTDILSLYENNIFAILLPQTNVMGGKLLAQRIEKSLHTDELISSLSLNSLKISFGISGLDARCKTLCSLLGAAELALSTAMKGKSNIVTYDDVISSEGSAQSVPLGNVKSIEPPRKTPNLTDMRSLAANMISEDYNILSYPAFLIMAKHELLMAARNRTNLLVMLLRIYRQNSEGKEENLPITVVYEFIKNIAFNQRSADILARFWDGNFAIIRPNSTQESLGFLAQKINTTIADINLLHSLTDAESLRVETKIFTLQKSNTSNNLIDMVSVQ